MADTVRLILTMESSGTDRNFSYNYANAETTAAQVKALGASLVDNGSFFEYPPTALKAARIVTTTTEEYDLS